MRTIAVPRGSQVALSQLYYFGEWYRWVLLTIDESGYVELNPWLQDEPHSTLYYSGAWRLELTCEGAQLIAAAPPRSIAAK